MPQHGARANRNAGHRTRRARLLASAQGDDKRLAAAYDWFRSSAGLLSRRRPPYGTDRKVHQEAAARLTREAAGYLQRFAEAIDRGDYDARKG
jgi:hypothetical protein